MTAPSKASGEPSREGAYGWGFWGGLVVGWAAIAYGVRWALVNARYTRPPELGRWLGLTILAHDLVFAPLVAVVGAVLSRLLPRWARMPVQVALGLSVVLTLVGLPPLTGYGDRASNPTLNPLDYGANLLGLLAVVWGGAVVWAAARAFRARRQASSSGSTSTSG